MIARNFLVALVALAPVIAAAQWQEGPPMAAAGEGERPRQYGRFAPPSMVEIEEAATFMQEHAPNRWQAIQTLPEDGTNLRRNVMGFVVARYRALQGLKEEDTKLYEIKLQQLSAEDEIYGMLADAGTPEQREKLREKLGDAAKKMMDLTLAERQQRIVRLKEIVSQQERNLAGDRQQVDKLVSARVEALINDGQSALRDEIRPGGRREHRRDRATTQPVPIAPTTKPKK